MRFPGKLKIATSPALRVCFVTALAFAIQGAAHENHAPLPAKGVTIAGDTIMLSDKARKAIGLTTAKIKFGDIHRTITVNARVELPWHAQTMITSLVPGKVTQVLVRLPGAEVEEVLFGRPVEVIERAAEVEEEAPQHRT